MDLYRCVCGSRLFFENSQCLSCGREVGWCPNCRGIRSAEPTGDGSFVCQQQNCGQPLVKCTNYAAEQVCNRFVARPPDTGSGLPAPLCDCCQFNETIPDLSVEGNRERWLRIEAAKRRLLYILDVLGLPYGTAQSGSRVPLSFDFKGDQTPARGRLRATQTAEKVYTGHDCGKITINIREADDAEREALRVDLGEAHRTLIGHFRHEIAHYYWDLLVQGICEDRFRQIYGDERDPTYEEALKRHYANGAPAGWESSYISAYATMHPWEDWAETFALYLDMVSVLETTANVGLTKPVDRTDLQQMLAVFAQVGVVANELNRTMGLLDLVPEVITPAVEQKLEFVHRIVQENRRN